MTTRRKFLSIILGTTALVGCNSSPLPAPIPQANIQKVVDYLNIIAVAFDVMTPVLSGLINPSILDQIAKWIGVIKLAALEVVISTSNLSTQNIISQGLRAIESIISTLQNANIAIPKEVVDVLNAAQILIPIIQTLIGLGVLNSLRGGAISEVQAVAILKGYAASHAKIQG